MALDELVEGWRDLAQQEIKSRVVLLPVPSRWGRTHVLNEFAAFVEHDEAVCIVIPISGESLPDGLGLQALDLQDLFAEARVRHRVAELLGVDRLGGVVQLGLGVAGLFASPLAALVGLLLAGVGVGAVGKVWDDSSAGQEGAVARLARAVAAVSVSVPVIVIIDDADRLDLDLAVVLVENLIGRVDGQVLVVAAINPGGDLMSALTSRATYGLTEGRVRIADNHADMDYQARVDLAAELYPELPTAAIRRIGQRAGTFADVFSVASAERLAELCGHGDDAAIVTVMDEVIDAQFSWAPPSKLAVVLAWAGGILHARQADHAVEFLSGEQPGDDVDVMRFESLVRLTDPASPRLAEQVRMLPASKRHHMAEITLSTALEISRDPQAGLVDKIVAWRSAHRVRGDLQDRTGLLDVQCQLVHDLEGLGDFAAAYEIARTALAEYLVSQRGDRHVPERDDLSAALLRLARRNNLTRDDALIDATVAAAAAGGAAVGLEARIWAAIDLLGQSGQRDRALELIDQITAELSHRKDLGVVGNRWRLQLAFAAGRAGFPGITQQLLAPMLNTPGSPHDEDAARGVLFAVGGPRADTRLQIVGLEAELTELPLDSHDDRLRVHIALSADYADLGDYRRALHHGEQELVLRRRIQGADHPRTLTLRTNIAFWTNRCGNLVEARRLFLELLREKKQILGPDHPDTLATRCNVASSTGECGDPAGALQLFQELLPRRERVLGQSHPDTLLTRGNIASWTEHCGDRAGALRLFQELLPDLERVQGPDHRDTLTVRGNIAFSTGECGDPAGALQLFQELLPDVERVQGPDHPGTLTVRGNVASWTGQCGDPVEALRLFRKLLPERERIMGSDHPDILMTRHNIAGWTGKCGDQAGALQLFRMLLPDQERVLGLGHPDTLATRSNIAALTGKCGDGAGALRLFRKLLPNQERILSPDHPDTLATRGDIAYWTGACGDPIGALRLCRELLPDQERVLGPDDRHTLATRSNIAFLTGECGNPAGRLRLFRELMSDLERALGPHHSQTLATQHALKRLTASRMSY